MKIALALMAATVLLAAPSAGQARSGLKAPEFVTFSGQCLRVAMGKQDMTPACTGMLGGSEHADGRNGIYFLMANNHIVTFSGKATDKRGGFPIDRVVFNTGEEAVKPQAVRATGRCSYTDPSRGPVTIRCVGALAEGTSFVASFRTDGTPPQ
ncbi:hypothetical protein J5J10_04930 [Ciceribacter sp. L1K23]|uniref:hypothetical protein n=1 Tax=Ciceribacter sp. L1K23 TaxID=2820276 RepID=UPI001B81554D|nr:hypothetical protein [Ciceribacter sp. L1K23]MBR0555019.1 hypothetical protein [Ciceribacter sp. L1K23]